MIRLFISEWDQKFASSGNPLFSHYPLPSPLAYPFPPSFPFPLPSFPVPSFPLPSRPFPSHPISYPFIPSPPLRSRPPVLRLGGLGKRSSSPSGSGQHYHTSYPVSSMRPGRARPPNGFWWIDWPSWSLFYTWGGWYPYHTTCHLIITLRQVCSCCVWWYRRVCTSRRLLQ